MFPVSYFLLEKKKEYKTYTFFKKLFFFFQPVGDRTSPTFKGNSIVGVFLLVFICNFFFLQVSIYAGITNFGGYVFL